MKPLPLDDRAAWPQAGRIANYPSKGRHVSSILRIATLSGLVLLAGCTTYTYDDGSRQTLWGIPAEEETRRYEDDRQAEGVRYRVPGQIEENRRED